MAKSAAKTAKKNTSSPRKRALGTSSGKRASKPYPQVTLEQALTVAQEIKAKNAGNPWATEDIANAVGRSAKTNEFYYLTAASRDFGLTEGTRNTAQISLTELGRRVVYARGPEEEASAKKEAFLRVEIFKKVLEYYKGSDLPEMKYLGNTLEREFGLAPEYHDEFSRLFRENCEYLGITAGQEEILTDEGENAEDAPRVSKPTVMMGEPKSKTNLKAFVIMPFVEKDEKRPKGFFSEVLRSLVTPAGIDAGFRVETANRQGSDLIQSTIINDLMDADLVIADLTDHNPNVLFELGIRMANEKPVALIKASGTGRIFDVDNMLRVHEYNANLWRTTTEKDVPDLAAHIKASWENRDRERSYMKILRDAGGRGDGAA
jgi:hypothetical protein